MVEPHGTMVYSLSHKVFIIDRGLMLVNTNMRDR